MSVAKNRHAARSTTFRQFREDTLLFLFAGVLRLERGADYRAIASLADRPVNLKLVAISKLMKVKLCPADGRITPQTTKRTTWRCLA